MEPSGPSQIEPVAGFRPGTPEDIPRLQAMARVIWLSAYRDLIGIAQIEYMLGRMYCTEALRTELARGVHYEFIVVAEAFAGYLAFETETAHPLCVLHKLYLQPEHVGRGLAQTALEHIKTCAAGAGAQAVHLRVHKANERAVRAYLRAGFSITSSVCTDIGQGFQMDDHIMTCGLGRNAGHSDAPPTACLLTHPIDPI